MDIRVQELLEKIKRDGVDSAEAEAAKIISEAEAKRAAIVATAEKEAKAIVARAVAEAERAEASGKAALTQASRDLILAFSGEMQNVLGSMVRSEIDASFDAGTIQKVLPVILEAWAKDGRDDLSVLLPARDLASLEAFFKDKLGAALKKGMELKPLKDAKAGFRIVEKGGAAYYDFSAQAVADMLGSYLNARLAAIAAAAVAEAAK
ncbi:MAG: V-type ATP synthase subunit E [Spirochaetae bacterium HGW-Spirochaetae-3]|jgi:V/A-type H+-transporting ATPase subunit E|nr:MAG: V-type ATP synthase subunit E [Spirochaetae bacterium HGW-Spirochaetae-3]